MVKKRVYALDEIRGFCILCMVVYHLMYDLKFLHGVDVPIFFEGWFGIIRDVFAGTFIFISGCVTQYSSNNLKRGVECFFIGMIVTFVTAFATPGAPVYFGILHMLGISMMLYGLLERVFQYIPSIIGLVLFGLLFVLTINTTEGYWGVHTARFWLPEAFYDARLLFPLGFKSYGFVSGDYFPLLPWLFLFLSGSYMGDYFARGIMPKFMYAPHIPPLGAIGRYTIWIYVLHQPIIFVILNLIFKGSIF